MLLTKHTRKKYLEQDWLSIKNTDSNPSQLESRLKNDVTTCLSDLTLISRRLPDEEQARVFDTSKIEELLTALMIFEKSAGTDLARRPKNFKIAMILIKFGLYELKQIYDKLFDTSPYMTELVSDKILDNIRICENLTLGVLRSEIEREAIKDKLLYLFSIDHATTYELKQFENYILGSIPIKVFESAGTYRNYVVVEGVLVETCVDEYVSRFEVKLVDKLAESDIGFVTIILDKMKLTGKFIIDLPDITRIINELIVKKKDSDYLFYIPLK